MTTRMRFVAAAVALTCGVCVAVDVAMAQTAPQPAAPATTARFALLIQGASGEEQYATLHRRWLDSLSALLRDKFKYDAAHLVVLAEQPKAGEERSTAEALKGAVTKLAATVKPGDQLAIVLIGHGSGQGQDMKFNLIGPDLSVAEWAALLKPVQGRLAIIDTTSASFPYLAGLAGPGRVVITATSSSAQRYHTVFPEGFLKAFANDDADTDKNGRISLLEAFTYASRDVKQSYEQGGKMATETAMLDDDGDGKGRLATAEGADGAVAAVTYFDTPVVATSSDPETQRLLVREQALKDQLDELRRKRTLMTAEEYDKEFERLATELATVSQQIRRRTTN